MAEHFEVLEHVQIISPSLAERTKKAVGFRNIAIHSYHAIDWTIMYQICTRHLDDFREFAKTVTRRLHI